LGIKAGDEVIVPAVTFIATASAVTEVGAVPVFADIDINTGQISAASIAEKITGRTRAVIGVHYGGYPFEVEKVKKVCEQHGLFLIEDAAHAHGTEWKSKKAGTFGEFGSFSFQLSKTLTSGEGGAIITKSGKLFEKARLLHDFGRVPGKPFYLHYILSSNYRMTEFSAAVLVSQLKHFQAQTEKKQKNAEYLKEALRGTGLLPLKKDRRITQRGYYYLIFRYLKKEFGGLSRDKFLRALQAEGVPVMGTAYGVPLYRYPCFEKKNLRKIFAGDMLSGMPDYKKLYLPEAEQFCEEQMAMLHHILLSPRKLLDGMVEAVEKIRNNIAELKRP
jgi:dTDP-4-amino-4,6-dideoxygalactose transaminase